MTKKYIYKINSMGITIKANMMEWFFYAFLLTSMLSVKKMLFSRSLKGTFNEFASGFLYVSDFFLLLTLLSCIYFTLYNKNRKMSTKTILFWSLKQKILKFWENIVPRGTIEIVKIISKEIYTQVIHNWLAFLLISMNLWWLISILWSNEPIIALFKFFKLAEFSLFFCFLLKIVPRGTIFKNILWITMWMGVTNSFLGIMQVAMQHSLGLTFLRESLLAPTFPGVAKVIFAGKAYIRAYGLFPHPNVLAGFLLFSISCTIILKRYWKKQALNCSTWNNLIQQRLNKQNKIMFHLPEMPLIKLLASLKCLSIKMFHVEQSQKYRWQEEVEQICTFLNKFVPRGTFLWAMLLFVQIVGLIFTGSKSAIFGLLVGFLFFWYSWKNKFVPRGTNIAQEKNIPKLFHVEQWSRKIVLIVSIGLMLLIVFKVDMDSLLFKSWRERLVYLNVSRGTIFAHPWLGLGVGQFVFYLASLENISSWQLQPIHNVFWLILSENGIIGLMLWVFFLSYFFGFNKLACRIKMLKYKNVPRGTKSEISLAGVRGAICKNKLDNNQKEASFDVILFKALLAAFVFIMLFDHYFWDIQQGQIILWLLLAIVHIGQKQGTLRY